jgi:hypothetical protein
MARTLRCWWHHWLNRFVLARRQGEWRSRQRPVLEALEDRWLLAAYLVTSTADSGAGTLRDAITQVDAGSYNEIDFKIGTVGSTQTISVVSALPKITSAVFINGLTQGGVGNATRLITLNCVPNVGSGLDGLLLAASNCSISGLLIEGFGQNGIEVEASNNTIGSTAAGAGNVFSGNGNDGILIDAGVSGVQVQGDFLGTDSSGTKPLGNTFCGVEILGANNTIGGTTAGAGNVISGNVYDGIGIEASGVVVQGNFIGTNASGTSALANTLNGVEAAASTSTIGGTAAGAGNVISGNGKDGIRIDNGCTGLVMQGNFIGTNAAGTSALGNGGVAGIQVMGPNNTIGGTAAGAGNVLSGNTGDGVEIDGGISGVQVQGNLIGINASGTSALANSIGVADFGNNNTLGGAAAAARNVISGNNGDGVLISTSGSGVQVQGNFIGTNAAGTSAVANLANGMEDAGSSNTIGGIVGGAGNVLSGNNGDGVLIDKNASSNQVQGNFIGTNAAGTSALGNGVNGVALVASNNTIGGTSAGAGNVLSGNGTDGVLLGIGVSGVKVQGNFIGTNAAGTSALGNVQNGVESASSNNTIGGTTAGSRNVISGNSDAGVLLDGAATGLLVQGNFIGTNAAGSSALANSLQGVEIIGSNNSVGGTSAGAGNVLSGNASDGVLIDSPATGVQVQGNLIGTDATGSLALGNGFAGVEDQSPSDTIGGTTAAARNVISGNVSWGVLINFSASRVQVQGNYIGTDVTGNLALANSVGVGVATPNNTIGGTTAGAGNVISGNLDDGLSISVGGDSGNQVQGNLIGTNAAGTAALGNSYGVVVYSSNNTIGGTVTAARNIASGNNEGVLIDFAATGVAVQGNYIGTDATGTSAVANYLGIVVNSSNNTIGGTNAAARNVVSGNRDTGIMIDVNVSGVMVQGNYVGPDASASSALGNGYQGVEVEGPNNTIGGTVAGAGNLLSGDYEGVLIGNSAPGVQVLGNFIGTNAAGSAPLANTYGVFAQSPNCTIGGTTTAARNIISGNSLYGIQVSASALSVLGNYIGTDVSGTVAVPNGWGVVVFTSNNTIGGTTTAARNIISGNQYDGIGIAGSASGVQVQGNYIGTTYSGSTALGNGDGIEAQGNNNTLGGTTASARNVISGNDLDGIVIDSGTTGVAVLGNYIGTAYTGTSAVANANGIEIAGSNNTLGGTTTAARNVIAGTSADGVLLDSGASGNAVQGNFIGTNYTGSSALGNGGDGIEIAGSNNTLGGSISAARNYISGNSNDGLLFDSSASGNQVQSNFIGVAYSGSTALGNGVHGVEVSGTSNTIGGTLYAQRNIISGNAADGVLLNSSASANQVLGNFIGLSFNGLAALSNSGNGIEVFGSNNTLGGTTAGSRNVISANTQDGVLLNGGASGNQVQGNDIGTTNPGTTALGNSGNGIEVLGNNNTLGGTAAAARNVIAGNLLDGVLLNSGVSGNQVQGNYIGTALGGTASLANSGNGVEVMGSNNTIGGTLAGARNLISGNAQDGVLLDSTASGVLVQGNYVGTASTGGSALANSGNGVEVYGTNNTIGGSTASSRNILSGNSSDGVLIDSGASGTSVQGNYIGTDVSGKLKLSNSGSGIEVGENNALVGGSSVTFRNIISGNGFDGILIDSGVSGARVQGNFIGTDVTGTIALANYNGIEVAGSGNTLGGTTLAVRNVISGNSNNGVQLDSGASGNQVQGNYIGINASSSAALANSGYGVSIAGRNNSVGSSLAAAANTIADNSQGGVLVSAGSGDSIRHNAIYANGPSNTGPGIVLATGANNNLAAPTLSTATLNGTILTVTGTFNAATANVPYILEFFVSPAGDAEGKVYVGKLTVTPTSTGTQSFTFTTSTTAASSTTLITATLTDASGDTSAFSSGVTS